ncbi:MAG: HAD family hydrolase [Rhodospirillales bacterium]
MTPFSPPARLPKAVVFDWDNTLVDTWPIIHDALNHTFRAFGLREWTIEETHVKVRKSLRDSFPGLFGDAWEQAGDVFYERYGAIHAEKLQPAAGAGDLIRVLADANIYLCVVSNKKGAFLRTEADALGWTGHFGALVGATDAPQDKPARDPVDMALSPGGVAAGADVWFVGDADIDMECAYGAGCYPVLVHPDPPSIDKFGEFPPALYFTDCDSLCKFTQTL